jgi:folate-binding protein YgfZ
MRFIDLSNRAKFRVSGNDRVRYLNGQLTNDVATLKPGHALYAFALTAKGKLASDLFLTAYPGGILVDAPDEAREVLLARLERYIVADDVQIEDVSDGFRLIHFLTASTTDLTSRPTDAVVSATSRYRQPGVDLFWPVGLPWPVPGIALDEAAAETLRVERLVPRWGLEIDEGVLPQELQLDDLAISYTKGCYLGQEVVSRIRSVGHVNRLLVKVRQLDNTPLHPGLRLAVPERPPMGTLTSIAPLPTAERFSGLAFVRREAAVPNTQLVTLDPKTSDLLGLVEVCSLPGFAP